MYIWYVFINVYICIYKCKYGRSMNGVLKASKYLTHNLENFRLERYFSKYLLIQIRGNIKKEKKLSYHLYQCLKVCMYKPQAFFKGLLFELLNNEPTLRECQILASVIHRVSIPVIYSSVALLKLLQVQHVYAWLFIKVIVSKRYSLPLSILNALHNYLLKYSSSSLSLPVLFHQLFLVFVQNYSCNLYIPIYSYSFIFIFIFISYSYSY